MSEIFLDQEEPPTCEACGELLNEDGKCPYDDTDEDDAL